MSSLLTSEVKRCSKRNASTPAAPRCLSSNRSARLESVGQVGGRQIRWAADPVIFVWAVLGEELAAARGLRQIRGQIAAAQDGFQVIREQQGLRSACRSVEVHHTALEALVHEVRIARVRS